MTIRDGDWELDHELSVIGFRYVWKRWDGNQLTIRTDYPVDPMLDANSAQANASSGERWGYYRKVASIPVGLVYGENREAFQDPAWLKRWLNDSDNAKFRTFGGRV